MRDLLTEEDRVWLNGLELNLNTWRDLTIARLKNESSGELMSVARDGNIFHQGSWHNAGEIAETISKSITWNAQIYEAWRYGFVSAIHSICRKLSSFDADILLTAAGCANEDLGELSRESTEAVADARRELYGDEDDNDDDDDDYHYYASGGGVHEEEEFVETIVDDQNENEEP